MINKNIISYVGLKELEEDDQELVIRLTEEYFPKIQIFLKNIMELVVHIKQYEKEGHRSKWSMSVRAQSPSHVFESTKAAEWELPIALHKAFKDLESQIKHKLHSDSQWDKPYE
ncbi:hypothetical protein ACFLZ7_00675 [Nanoarchaeota archaeon]